MDDFKKKAGRYDFIIVLFFLLFLSLSTLLNNKNNQSKVLGIQQKAQSQSTSVSVFIGDHHFSIFGYTSPYALVTFDGQGIFDQTYADENGFFNIGNRFSPLSQREACLSAKDQFGRISAPICLPPFPIEYDADIGPIIIAPTVSMNQEYYYMGDKIILSGQTIPNSDVNFSVFTNNQDNLLSSVVKPVDAFTFPKISSKSDSKGNFSLSIPSSNPEAFRLFAQTIFDSSMSPTSIKLNFKVMPIWMIIIQFFTLILSLIRGRWLELVIIGEILMVLYFILPLIFHHKNLAIVLKKNKLPAIFDHYPLVSNP